MAKITEISNPVAVGWRWEFDGSQYEVAWIRNTETLLYSVRSQGRVEWSKTQPMAKPRWEVSPPTLARAREVAKAFITEGEGRALAFG